MVYSFYTHLEKTRMPSSSDLKRQNFNVTPEQEAELLALQSELGSPSVAVIFVTEADVRACTQVTLPCGPAIPAHCCPGVFSGAKAVVQEIAHAVLGGNVTCRRSPKKQFKCQLCLAGVPLTVRESK